MKKLIVKNKNPQSPIMVGDSYSSGNDTFKTTEQVRRQAILDQENSQNVQPFVDRVQQQLNSLKPAVRKFLFPKESQQNTEDPYEGMVLINPYEQKLFTEGRDKGKDLRGVARRDYLQNLYKDIVQQRQSGYGLDTLPENAQRFIRKTYMTPFKNPIKIYD